jgi:hypothetical protein
VSDCYLTPSEQLFRGAPQRKYARNSGKNSPEIEVKVHQKLECDIMHSSSSRIKPETIKLVFPAYLLSTQH